MKNVMKRTTFLFLCAVMIFTSVVATYAYGSSPAPSINWPNYYTYVEVYDIASDPYATAYMNLSGMTYDLHAQLVASVKYSDQMTDGTDYSELSDYKTLDDINVNDLPSGYTRRITDVSTDPLVIYEGSTLMHTYASSYAIISTFEYDEDGIPDLDYLLSEADCVHSDEHNWRQCTVCREYVYID